MGFDNTFWLWWVGALVVAVIGAFLAFHWTGVFWAIGIMVAMLLCSAL